MIFEYQQQKTFMNAIDVVDAGNMCLRCTSLEGEDYYILTKTIFGKLHILKIGPIIDGLDELFDGFMASYRKCDYKEQTIAKEVSLLLNDTKKKINEVTEIQPEELMQAVHLDILQLFQHIE